MSPSEKLRRDIDLAITRYLAADQTPTLPAPARTYAVSRSEVSRLYREATANGHRSARSAAKYVAKALTQAGNPISPDTIRKNYIPHTEA
jgi:hypothetical protein